MFIALASI